jgi:predicted membrane protein
MKVLEQVQSLKSIEIFALLLFILFIIFPFKIPFMIANIFDSSFGIILLFIVAIYLFFYTNPMLGIIFILVAYELIRRSSKITGGNYIVRDNTTQLEKDIELERLNPQQPVTLEEEVINKMAPARNEFIKGDYSNDFQAVSDSTIGASMFN